MIRARTKEWAGKIPAGWSDGRLKDSFFYSKGLNITKADLVDDGVAVVSYGQIHAKHNSGTHLDPSLIRYVPEEIAIACPNSKLKKGDVVFADTSEDLEGVGNCVLNDSDGVVYAGYHTLIASARFPEHSKYLSYLFQTDAWRGQIRTRASGIKVFSLTQRVLNPVTVILPPLSEQKRIAAFLDAKCADIDKAIAAKRKQLDCIDEMWKNILYKATTQGIGSSTQDAQRTGMQRNAKNPGDLCVEDMQLPQGWRRVRLKRMFSYAKGLNITKADLVDDGVAVVSYGQIHAKHNTGTHLDPSLIRYVPEKIAVACPNSRLKKGDVVFADTSEDLEGVGNCVLNDSDGVVYAGYHALIASARFPEHSKYLTYLFQTDAWRGQIRTRVSGIKVFSLTQRVLNPVTVILPPLPEQKRIAEYLDAKRKNLDELKDNLRRQIEVLEQYRKSLIHECVTGKRRIGE